MNRRAKEILRTRKLVLDAFDHECPICGVYIDNLIDSHIYPRGSNPELSAVVYNRVPLCFKHDKLLEYKFNDIRRTPTERIDWLRGSVCCWHRGSLLRRLDILEEIINAPLRGKAVEFRRLS